jgi:hypothetical protein
MFADDTCLFLEVDNRDTCSVLINEDLNDIERWAKRWLVNFSAAKTKSMIISNLRDRHLNSILQFCGAPIENVDTYTYLGLIISYNLRWNAHIDAVSTKARKRLNAALPLKFKLDRKALETIYLGFILPTMEYGNIVWGGTFDSDLVKLEKIQIDALRFITGATARSNIANLYEDTNLPTIEQRISVASCCMMYKIINGIAPAYLQDILVSYRNHPVRYTFRNRADHVSPYTKEVCRNSFFHKGISLWENLPENYRNKPSVSSFKAHVKKDYPKKNLLYYYGRRWPQVHHSRIRIGCSKLNWDLFNNLHVIDSMECLCGYYKEDAEHYFFQCPRFEEQRTAMMILIQAIKVPSTNLLIYGDPDLTLGQNVQVFEAVHSFITDTERFI